MKATPSAKRLLVMVLARGDASFTAGLLHARREAGE